MTQDILFPDERRERRHEHIYGQMAGTADAPLIPMRTECAHCVEGCIKCRHMSYGIKAPPQYMAHTFCLIERAWLALKPGTVFYR